MKKIFIALGIIAAIAVAGLGTAFLTGLLPGYFGKPDEITVGVYPEIINAPLYVADGRGLFRSNGLNVTIRSYDTGLEAGEAMERGEVDIAAMSEYAFAEQVCNNTAIAIIANHDESQRFYIISQTDRGITTISDLKGRAVGVTPRTIPEFYLGRFLALHDMSVSDVKVVNLNPRQFTDAFRSGKIDAFIAEEPAADELRQQNETVTMWPAQGGQPTFNLLAGRKDWIAGHRAVASRFLRSLDAATAFTGSSPAEAKAIVQERLNISPQYIGNVWNQNQFSLSLDQSLVTAMEDESRWMIANNMTSATAVPDFRAAIYPDILESIKPGAVNIIGLASDGRSP